jgi:pimeloyl-ACP methyl ester carboxylesterase
MVKGIIQSFIPKMIGLRLKALYAIKPKKAVYKAFLLFCTPRAGFVKPHQKDYLQAHKAEQLQFKKIKIQTYRWKGKGHKVLLLHGWDSNSYRWKDLIVKLKALDMEIMAFDAPAQGNSEGNLLNAVIYEQVLQIAQEHFKPDVVVGHSMGGMTSIFNQHKHSNLNVKKFILLGAPSDLQRIMDGFQKILGLNKKFMIEVENYLYNRYGYRFNDFHLSNFAKSVNVPTLIVHDKYDKVVPVKEAYEIHETIENSKLVITEGAGHSLNKERVHKAVISFLKAS